jgi:hypothetical protein
LASIASSGLIVPNYDAFDLNRPMQSVSLAKSRMYGRAYADMHGKGSQESGRYGSSLFWACAFLGDVAVEAAKEVKAWHPAGYYQIMEHLLVADAVSWFKKMTRMHSPSLIDVYRQGSDITDNYPVLFGIRSSGLVLAETSQAVSIHERRTEHPLSIAESVTHVEVPECRISITNGLVDKPVLPIELGERYAANFSFSDHIGGVI